MEQASKATGLKFKIYENNLNEEWHQLINNFKAKKIDILPTVSYSDERTLFLDFSIPYIQTSLAIIGHKDNNNHGLNLDQVRNSVVAIPSGYWLNEYINSKSNGNTNIYDVNNTEEAFHSVDKKLADYTICEIPIFTYYRELADYKNLRIAGQLDEKNDIMLGVQKDLPELRSILNKVIENIDKDHFFENSLVMPTRDFENKYLRILTILLSIIIIAIVCMLLKTLYNLISTKRQLEISFMQKQKFMEDISHDLKTPLMITMGYIDAIVDREIKDERLIQSYLKRVQSSTLYIQSLVNDLFTLSKLENNIIKLQKEEIYVNKLIEEIVSIIRIKIKQQNIQVVVNLESTIHTLLEIDALRIRQVLNNILNNAVKYTPNGTIIISTKLLDMEKIQISIQDNGFGIPEEDLAYVFDRYHKSKNNKDPQSSGLGLCIAKQLVVQHGGEIWVESSPSKGSTFYIEILLPQK